MTASRSKPFSSSFAAETQLIRLSPLSSKKLRQNETRQNETRQNDLQCRFIRAGPAAKRVEAVGAMHPHRSVSKSSIKES